MLFTLSNTSIYIHILVAMVFTLSSEVKAACPSLSGINYPLPPVYTPSLSSIFTERLICR